MTYEELQRRASEARCRMDADYWDDWLSSLEWNQFVSAVAIIQDWDGQLKEMMKQGYLTEHPMYPLYSPEAQLEGRAT